MNYSALLDVYSLTDILEYNDLSDEDVLQYLVEQRIVKLPTHLPVDLDD